MPKRRRDTPVDGRPDTPDLRDASRGIRLHKLLAEAGVCSRRAAEELIEEGRVTVNGARIAESPCWVDPEKDRVAVDGRPVEPAERKVYILLYKPRNTLSTTTEPDGRRTVADLVEHPSGARLYPVGRLDYDTTGLLLMTNDGALANRLTHPRFGIHKTYRATVKGLLSEEEVDQLHKGIHLALRKEGRTVGVERAGAVKLEVVHRDRQADTTILHITLNEGRNRQVRRMLAGIGHRVKKLQRIQMGPLKLKGLRLGEWRELTIGEVRALRAATRPRSPRARRRRVSGAGGSRP